MNFDVRIAAVCERDLDLLLLEEAIASSSFQEWLIRQAGLQLFQCTLLSAKRSVTQSNGESDLELTFASAAGETVRLLLENKIGASFQPDQALRYAERSGVYLAQGECGTVRTMLLAPNRYFGEQTGALGFDSRVSYEDLRSWFANAPEAGPRRLYKLRLIDAAIEKGSLGYQPIADAPVTDWWRSYWELALHLTPELEMKEPSAKPARAGIIYFRPLVLPRGVEVCHKLAQGNVDLQFNGWGARAADFRKAVIEALETPMSVAGAAKSAAIRLKVPEVNTCLPFQGQQNAAEAGLANAARLLRWYLTNRSVLAERGLGSAA